MIFIQLIIDEKFKPIHKAPFIIGVLIGIWGFLFAIIIRPFEHGQMDLSKWIYVSVGFSFIAFLSYIFISFIQQFIFQKKGKWNTLLEVGMYFLFYALYAIATYIYYRSALISGMYGFSEFFVKIIFSLVLILTPLLYFARKYTLKLIPDTEADIVIKGENQLDILKIKTSELICISNAQNYVEIFYVEENELKSKLMRSSLKKMQTDLAFLIQIHRSHLINPSHFKSWKDSTTISLTKLDLPVSKKYKSQLLSF